MLFILINVSSVHVNPNKKLIFFFPSLSRISLFRGSFVADDPLGGEEEESSARQSGQAEQGDYREEDEDGVTGAQAGV